jgi:hypothetical protein
VLCSNQLSYITKQPQIMRGFLFGVKLKLRNIGAS